MKPIWLTEDDPYNHHIFFDDNIKNNPEDSIVAVRSRKSKYDNDLQDYIVEVYSTPDLPKSFMYKGDEKNGIHLSKLNSVFKGYVKYVDSSFGQFRKTIGIKFMDVK